MAPIMGSFQRKWRRQFVAFIALLTVGLSASAQDWVYRIRPGDTLWDLTNEFAKPEVQWQGIQRYNNIGNPHLLTPGTTLRVPLTWLRIQPARAKIIALHGSATITYPDGASATAAPHMELGIGVTIHTAAAANLALEFADGSRLTLHENSTLSLNRLSLYGKQGMADTELRLQHGRASSNVKPTRGNAGFTIDTPRACSAVRGTRFRVDADDSRSLTEVLEGQVVVTVKEHSTMIHPGYGIVANGNDAQPSSVTRLLPAPKRDTLLVSSQTIRPHAVWAPIAGASGYRIQVSTSRDFNRLLIDQTSPLPEFTLPPLANGDFWISVRAMDAQGLEGNDVIASFRIDIHPPPPFMIAPAQDSIVREQRPTFRWSTPEGAHHYHFELADTPDFTHPLVAASDVSAPYFKSTQPLAAGRYYWRVRSDDALGKHGPYSEPIGFELAPLSEPGDIQQAESASRRRMTFRWHAGPPYQHYRIQFSRHADFSHTQIDQIVEEPEITIPALASGLWHIRVQSISVDGHEGPISPVQTLRVPCKVCRVAAGSGALLILLAL